MFDIGFTEIILIAGIALFVVGPERLPEAVKSISLWIGRFKRSLRETRREIEQQIGADEIRRELHNEEIMQNLEKMRSNVNDVLNEDLMSEDSSENKTPRITETESDKDFYPEGHNDHDPNDDSIEKRLDAEKSLSGSNEFSENSIHPDTSQHSTKK
ncbi:MAG: Sec-independent protein translocase protein TatB [Cellvibrionaceae bacterium]